MTTARERAASRRAGPHTAFALALAIAVSALLPCTAPARAHYVGTALLHLVEQAEPGQFTVRFIPSTAMRRSDRAPTPVYPPSCEVRGEQLTCAPPGLEGSLRVDGLTPSSELIVQIDWQSGRRLTRVLTGGRDHVELEPEARQGAGGVLLDYARRGLEHIAEGADHLAFVLGLVLLVGLRRKLLSAITGFTLAHSLTLAASVTGLLVLRPVPVEALIASSLVLVANEAWRARRADAADAARTLTARFPASLAFGFGLVHGLGFGGALEDIGLPALDRALALLGFNLGVEAGQLLFVAALLALVKLPELGARMLGRRAPLDGVARPSWPTRLGPFAHGASTYLVGCAGAYLFILRVAALALQN